MVLCRADLFAVYFVMRSKTSGKRSSLPVPAGRKRMHSAIGRPSAKEAPGRFERLLDIATEVFLELGYAATSMDEIARRAGASKQTFYARYPTKADLFVAVMARQMDSMQEQFSRVLVSSYGIEQVLENFGRNLMDTIILPNFRALSRVVIVAAADFPEVSAKFWDLGPQRAQKMLADYLSANLKMGKKEAEQAAEMFCSICGGHIYSKLQLFLTCSCPQREIRDRVREAVRVFLAAYSL